jgi:hypothetical protein
MTASVSISPVGIGIGAAAEATGLFERELIDFSAFVSL